MTDQTLRIPDRSCERCHKRHLAAFVWLELDSISGTYHEPGSVSPERSQGLFPFGAQCATKQLSEGKSMQTQTPRVITKAEAEYALDQVEFEREFERLCTKHGYDTVLMWFFQSKSKMRQRQDERLMLRGTATDVR